MFMNRFWAFIFFAMLGLGGGYAVATPATLTYQGRIVGSDGAPLQHSSVSFIFQIISPNGSCILYEEQINGYNMDQSDGVFDRPIGEGTRTFPASGSFSVLDSLNNNSGLTCKGGAPYAPALEDGRRLRVQFHDGIGWKQIIPDNIIRSVPYAGFASSAAKIGNRSAGEFLLKTGIPSCGAGTVLSWSGSAFSCASISATSGAVLQSQLPSSCSANQTLTYISPSGNFSCSNIAISATQVSGSITGNAAGFTGVLAGDVSGNQGMTSVDKIKGVPVDMTGNGTGKVLTFDGSKWKPEDLPAASVGNPGTVTSVSSLNNYLTVIDGQNAPELTLHVGTTMNTVAAGNDSRIVNAIQNAGGVLTMQSGLDSAKGAPSVNGRIYIATDTQKIYRDNGSALVVVASVDAAGGSGTVSSVDADAPLSVVNSTTNPHISISKADGTTDGYITSTEWTAFTNKLSAVTGAANLVNGKVWIGDSGGKAQEQAITGEVSLNSGGVTKVTGLQGRAVSAVAATSGTFLKYDGTSWSGTALAVSDISGLATTLGNQATAISDLTTLTGGHTTSIGSLTTAVASKIDSVNMPASCAPDQTLTFSSPTGAWNCSSIAITGAAFGSKPANLVLASPDGTAGAPTFRSLTLSDLPSTISDGQWSASGGNVFRSTGRVGIGTSTPATALDVNGTIQAQQICDEAGANCKDISTGWGSGGSVTSIIAGTGLAGGTISTTGTISISPSGVTETELASNSVITTKINDAAVTTAKIADSNVTGAKLETVSGLTAGVYGSASSIPAVTVDSKGRVTAISTNAITGLLPGGSSGQYLKSNGSAWAGASIQISDIKNASDLSAFATTACAANEALSWVVATNTYSCQVIGSLDTSKVTTGVFDAARLPASVKLWQDGGAGNIYYNSGSVGVGTNTPRAGLDVNSTIVGKPATANATTTINFALGNLQYTSLACQGFNLNNMKDGASYTLGIQNTTAGTCAFNAFSDGGSTGLTMHLPPDHAITEAGKHTIYTFLVLGTHVYASWITGY